MTDATTSTDDITSPPPNSFDGVVIDKSKEKPKLTATPTELKRMLQVIEDDILPKTTQGVQDGNKVFGAAILDSNFNTVHADTNSETTCPLFHGEVKLIYEWSKLIPAKERGPTAQNNSIFLSTHEPCCMCISSILWAGFTKVYYFFSYTITSAQGIPHDINTMHELWGVSTYRKQNKYLSTICIMDLINELPEGNEKNELQQTSKRLMEIYDKLSNQYHTEKSQNTNNSLVLG